MLCRVLTYETDSPIRPHRDRGSGYRCLRVIIVRVLIHRGGFGLIFAEGHRHIDDRALCDLLGCQSDKEIEGYIAVERYAVTDGVASVTYTATYTETLRSCTVRFVDCDGIVNICDATRLQMYLAGYEV